MVNDRYREGVNRSGGGERGLFERAGDEVRSWFSDDDRERGGHERGGYRQSHYGAEHGYGGFQGDYSGNQTPGGFGGAGDYRAGRQSYSGQSRGGGRFEGGGHDHYLRWRQRQIEEMDRDYEEYCRERGQQFHSDFDSWRRSREGGRGPAADQGLGTSASQGSSARASQESALFGSTDETGATSGGGVDSEGSENAAPGGGRY